MIPQSELDRIEKEAAIVVDPMFRLAWMQGAKHGYLQSASELEQLRTENEGLMRDLKTMEKKYHKALAGSAKQFLDSGLGLLHDREAMTYEPKFEEDADFANMYAEAQWLMTERLLPPHDYGENSDCERLYDIIKESARRAINAEEVLMAAQEVVRIDDEMLINKPQSAISKHIFEMDDAMQALRAAISKFTTEKP